MPPPVCPAAFADPGKHTNGDRLLTAEQVAERWQCAASQIYRLSREGKLKTVMIGRYRRWRVADLELFESAGGV